MACLTTVATALLFATVTAAPAATTRRLQATLMVGHGSGGGDSGNDCKCGLSLEQNASFVGIHGWTIQEANEYECDCCDCHTCTSSTRADNMCYTCNGDSMLPPGTGDGANCSHHWIMIILVTTGFFSIVGVGYYLGVANKKQNEKDDQMEREEQEKVEKVFDAKTGTYVETSDDPEDVAAE